MTPADASSFSQKRFLAYRVGCSEFLGAARSFRAYPFTAVVVALLCAAGVFGSHALAHAAIGSRCVIWVEFSPEVQP
jgi:hypothetical protein